MRKFRAAKKGPKGPFFVAAEKSMEVQVRGFGHPVRGIVRLSVPDPDDGQAGRGTWAKGRASQVQNGGAACAAPGR